VGEISLGVHSGRWCDLLECNSNMVAWSDEQPGVAMPASNGSLVKLPYVATCPVPCCLICSSMHLMGNIRELHVHRLRCPCCATLLALPSQNIAYLACLRWYDRAGACPCRYSGNLDPGQWWSLRSQAQNTAEHTNQSGCRHDHDCNDSLLITLRACSAPCTDPIARRSLGEPRAAVISVP
jgi:hypothetical protein